MKESLRQYQSSPEVALGRAGFVQLEKFRAHDPARLPAPVVKFLGAFPRLLSDERERADVARALSLGAYDAAFRAMEPALDRVCHNKLAALCPESCLQEAWGDLKSHLHGSRPWSARSYDSVRFLRPDALDHFALDVGFQIKKESDLAAYYAQAHAARRLPS